jgi:hypothetical protein
MIMFWVILPRFYAHLSDSFKLKADGVEQYLNAKLYHKRDSFKYYGEHSKGIPNTVSVYLIT